ncbi:SIMPL domain-containing protein [Dechloromonas sp. ZY10]|uniref:SIMPL domain-containing protein n=1 Tax=Dechloromonas aquae TaxID=2664436 RepID=UPI003526D2FC
MKPGPIICLPLFVALIGTAQAGTIVELSAAASRPAANDRFHAQLYVEASAADASEVANRLNRELGEALRIARQTRHLTVRSGNQHAYPVFNREQKIESWRMRGELQLEANDPATLSAAVTALQQQRVALSGISQQPSAATRKTAEEGATEDAIRAFEARAGQIAQTLGKAYKLKRLNIAQESMAPPMLRGMAMAMEAKARAPMPLEAGESLVSVNVHGEIELAD